MYGLASWGFSHSSLQFTIDLLCLPACIMHRLYVHLFCVDMLWNVTLLIMYWVRANICVLWLCFGRTIESKLQTWIYFACVSFVTDCLSSYCYFGLGVSCFSSRWLYPEWHISCKSSGVSGFVQEHPGKPKPTCISQLQPLKTRPSGPDRIDENYRESDDGDMSTSEEELHKPQST